MRNKINTNDQECLMRVLENSIQELKIKSLKIKI